MSDKYILFGGGVARDIVVRMVMDEGDIPYELRLIDGVDGDHRTEEFLRLNPAGYIPALVTPEGDTLFETAAIMLYLAEKHQLNELVPLPGDPDRGRFLNHLFYHTSEIQPSFKRWFYPHRFSTEGVAGREKVMESAYDMLLDRWSVLNELLRNNGPFHLGERFSLLDMHMAMWANYGLKSSDDIVDRFAAVKRVYDAAQARPKSGHCLIKQREDMARWRGRTKHLTNSTGTY